MKTVNQALHKCGVFFKERGKKKANFEDSHKCFKLSSSHLVLVNMWKKDLWGENTKIYQNFLANVNNK